MKRVLWFLGVVISAANAAPISFSGSASAQTEYTIREGADLDREPFAWNLRINPTLTLWKLPLSFGFMLSSYDVNFRQPFNRFSLAMLPSVGLKTSWLDVQLLDTRPSYSSFTLASTNVRGGAIDLSPGLLKLSLAAGQIQRGVTGSDTSDVAYRRWLYAGRIGAGKEQESHLYINLLTAKDDSASISPYLGVVTDGITTDTVELAAPVENTVASLDGKLSLLEGKLSFDGELAGSAYSRDVRAAEVESEEIGWLPSFLFQPRMTTQLDWAGKLGSAIVLGSTRMGVGFEQIGWGYESVGVSFLDQDTRTWSASFSHMFVNPFPISLDMSGKLARDNLDGMKPAITRTQSGSINLGLYPAKAPTLTIGYAPYRRSAPGEVGVVDAVADITHTAWASSGFSFKAGERSQSLSLSLTFSQLDNRINPDREFLNWSATSSGRHLIIETLSAHWSGGMSSNQGADTARIYNTGLGTSLSLWNNRWRTSLDGFYSITASSPENKFTLRLRSGVEVFKNFNVDLTGQFIDYTGETASENYTELLGRAGLSYRW